MSILLAYVSSKTLRQKLTETLKFGAGIPTPLSEMTLENYRAQINVHNIGGFLFLKHALQELLKQEMKTTLGARHSGRGSIVMLTSLASEGAFLGVGNYTAAKFAVKGLVQTAGKPCYLPN